ncbi:MAG TPA: hypothetical protein DCM08_13540 [Microscillaceae bacterium]|nr:hypothetical protein [Microscillaceae bacterium]
MPMLERLWTYPELVEAFAPETRCEIIKNQLFMSPAPNTEHQKISRNLGSDLHLFVKKNQRGEVLFAPFDVILDDNNVVQPDIVFIAQENLKYLTKRGFEGVPDLLVEIISPSTFYRDSEEKKKLYEQYGVKEYWLIDPANQVVEIFYLENQQYQLHQFIAEQGKMTSRLLAGFEVDCKDIFPERNL